MFKIKFEDLPIVYRVTEHKPDCWPQQVDRVGTVKELLNTWDIDDESEMSEIAQVLRHLKWAMENLRPESIVEIAKRLGMKLPKEKNIEQIITGYIIT